MEGEKSPSEGVSKKPKRQMKTPFQLETLEKTYAMETYPSEATRVLLSEKLGLTDRQLQMWFCHRRLKDKKEVPDKKQRSSEGMGRTNLFESPQNDLIVPQPESDHVSRSISLSASRSRSESVSGSGSDELEDRDSVALFPRFPEIAPQRIIREVIACVEAQLGEPIREDGPILGLEFDDLPPGAFGNPIVVRQREHWEHSGQSYERKPYEQPQTKPIKFESRIPESAEPSNRSDVHGAAPILYDSSADVPRHQKSPFTQDGVHVPVEYGVVGQEACVNLLPQHLGKSSPLQDNDFIQRNEEVPQTSRKRKTDEAISGTDVQNHEKRIRKELEKQDILRRKREEQLKKEMEKQFRERRKEEERMMREKLRQEERFQREERREIERREKYLQKESLKAEKRRQKEELRREKEAERQKAAMERAAARKLAKESTELMEDERLELMELAASSKGLPSIVSLDYETLQNLESFQDSLCEFPPKSVQVQLKRPFSVQPWINSEENVGNLVMVWKFCMTFADVLGLWPFTLDELVQAFHDYDSRLLGEVHIALLKLIMKDIEDVARAPSGGLGTNQYTAINPEGGHPRIVEGAYTWGFDIRNWQKHLNPLTWPEILRQFSLSAGFGPKLKKESMGRTPDKDEDNGCEDVISMLRNGSAAEKAAMTMNEKSSQRRSRHRLTPGTVKFAAYHVLCLEGSKGLNVLELANKIQSSGLRDLTTSKTPDASISVALSRDPILFERIAPSTYCVRPAFRKDPENAEEIISSAKEKIQRYANGFLAGENADDVEEKDDDSDCDVAEGPEEDDLGVGPSSLNKDLAQPNDIAVLSGNEKEVLSDDVALDVKNKHVNADEGVGGSSIQGITEIDESKSGEPWVQGLVEGEYSDLCVEERLNALVALVGVANEGNTIRLVLEDRLDAAMALRKQMWAEAQLDKRRFKEECMVKCQDSSLMVGTEGGQTPLLVTENKMGDEFVKEDPSGTENVQNLQNGYAAERSRLQLKALIGHKAEERSMYRSLPLGQDRRRNRYWQFVASSSMHDPGTGRIFVELQNGHWRLIDSEEAFDALLVSLDTRGIRESHLHVMLQTIETSFKENVGRIQRASVASDESPSSAVLASSSDTWDPSSSFKIELGRNEHERNNAMKRYQDLETWMWKECFSSSSLLSMTYGKKGCMPLLGICEFCCDTYFVEEAICPSCHRTFSSFNGNISYAEQTVPGEDKLDLRFNNVRSLDSSPPRIRLIKALLTFLEVSVPSEAFESSWTDSSRKAWGLKLNRSVSTVDLLQILSQFEIVIKRDYLSPDFETTEELLSSCSLTERVVNNSRPGSVPELPWMPQTSAAVSLRLFELGSSISYVPRQKIEPQIVKETENIIKLPGKSVSLKSIGIGENGSGGIPRSRQTVRTRGGGARMRGRSQKRVAGGKISGSLRQSDRDNRTLDLLMQQGHARGRRTTIRRKRTEKAVEDERVPANFRAEDWSNKENTRMEIEDAENSSSERGSGSEDNGDPMRYEVGYRGPPGFEVASTSRYEVSRGYDGISNRSEFNSVEESDEDMNGDDDDDAEEENVYEEDDENLQGNGNGNYGSDEDGNVMRDDDSDSLVSGEYSD